MGIELLKMFERHTKQLEVREWGVGWIPASYFFPFQCMPRGFLFVKDSHPPQVLDSATKQHAKER